MHFEYLYIFEKNNHSNLQKNILKKIKLSKKNCNNLILSYSNFKILPIKNIIHIFLYMKIINIIIKQFWS